MVCTVPSIIIIISLLKLVVEWLGMLHAWEIINAHRILIEAPERKRSLGRTARKLEGNSMSKMCTLKYVVIRRTFL